MKRWIIRIVLAVGLLVGACVAFVWSVLAIPYFSDFRSGMVSDLLTRQIGQPLLVNGDVSVVIGPTSRVRASGVQIPSETMPDIDLARLDSLAFDFNLIAIANRQFDVNNLVVDGLQVNLLRREDNTESWSDRERNAIGSHPPKTSTSEVEPAPDNNQGQGVLAFLKTRTATFTDIRLIMDDQTSGFEYDFELEELSLSQLDEGQTLGVVSAGKMNGQRFALEGNYPKAAPFTTRATFSSAELSFDGVPFSNDEGGGFEAELDFNITSLGDLLDVLRLARVIDGTARMQTKMKNRAGIISLEDFSTVMELSKGQLITLSGDIADFGNRQGFDLEFNARLHPENKPPAPAKDLADLKVTNLFSRIISQNQSLELDDLLLSTNAFQHGLDKLGPVSIGRIRRTQEGNLAFTDIALQAGPLDAPILKARGNIFNVLELKDLDIEGNIDAPASIVLEELDEDIGEAFGNIEAEFAVDDSTGALGITYLNAQATNSDLWTMSATVSIADMATLDKTDMDFDINVEDGAEFLSALKLKPVDAGPLSAGFMVTARDNIWQGEIKLGAGTSELTGTVLTEQINDRNTINASIVSASMAIKDLQNAVAGAIELLKVGKQPGEADDPSNIALQPLVLSAQSDQDASPPAPKPSSDVELQPLVIAGAEDKIIDVNEFLRETDIYGLIDFEKISGVDGITQIKSEFASEGGKARLGPLEFNYGGGYFNFRAAMDVVEAPRFVTVSGATSGWNLSDILKTVGVKLDANGDISGQFSVAGNLTTIESFVNTMRGSAAVRLSNGQVATSLLELAGLGLFPWLFSQERRQGYTEIACVNAPFNIQPGSVSFDPIVAETSSVQLVAQGSVDWTNDTILIRAEPRPLGRPLARSAWPFDVTGKLSDPRFKLDIGGSRSRRADGAEQMPANRKPCERDILQLQ